MAFMPDMKKVEAIMNIQPPQNVTEVKMMMVMVHYLGRFLPGLAKTAQMLNDLLKQGCKTPPPFQIYFQTWYRLGRLLFQHLDG